MIFLEDRNPVTSHNEDNPMSLAKAKTFLRDIGMTIKLRDGEYQVNFANAKNDRATYYTNDIDDAVSTAIFMAYHEGST